ncbi:MAG: polyprenyl synthetase family protein [Gammaproteobacteria bacterium]|nr:polyprenyl synthetase family protein [Gammaproteobacteria bacterium]
MLERLHSFQQRINQVLETTIAERRNTMPERLFDAINYSVLDAGKRLRPALTYAVGEALGTPLSLVDAPAAAIELIHCYSLVHDDLPAMDDDDLRRGKPTTHIAFDEATAILVGDALQAMAFDLLSQATELTCMQRLEMIRVLSRAAGANGMVAGQMRDMMAEHTPLTIDELRRLHQQKTGALIEAAVSFGGLASTQANEAILHGLERYGAHLGLAFQIQDDILDVTETSAQLGKPQGSDERNDKTTFVSLLGLAEAKNEALKHVSLAKSVLQECHLHSDLLTDLCDYIVERTH